MMRFIHKYLKRFLTVVILVITSSVFLYAFSAGITGRTKKTTNTGCSCHGQNPVTEVMVSINGPDTINTNQTALFFLTITKLSKNGAGLDIAVRNGILSPVSNNIRLSGDELTHNSNIPMTNGTVTVQFNYTAPDSVTIDTIWATGIATNSDGNVSGDNWNWANSKRVIVRNPIGVQKNSESVPKNYVLEQNYPNPFNPSTKVKFSLPRSSSVELAVYDMNGREVEVLVNQNLQTGVYEADWHPVNLSSGIYFYTLITSEFSETKKMMFLK